MSSITAADDNTHYPQKPIPAWSEADGVVTLSSQDDADIQFTATVKENGEDHVQHYTVTLDKNPESGSESEAFTPCGSLVSENGANGGSMILSTLPGAAAKGIELRLENEELWQKFCRAGTEMIITKAGRRMFPAFSVTVTGLLADQKYTMTFTCLPANDKRYKYVSNKWVVAGKGESHIDELLKYVHLDSPASGRHWMSNKLSFKKVKLTNSKTSKKGNISLNSMHKYIPTVTILKSLTKKQTEVVHVQEFPQAAFFAVTAYQNDEVTQLKIDNNPFAKAFRESPSETEIGSSSFNNWSTSGQSPSSLYGPPASPLLSPHWAPTSPLLSAYHDLTQAAGYMSSGTGIPMAAPSPLPQFGTVFGSLDTGSYTISNPFIRSALGHLSHFTTSS